MCIIACKPLNVAFPKEEYLENCFDNNDHGAGFMYAYNGVVHIQKGYETFKAFKAALTNARKITGDNVPYVMHFRIATQGFDKCMTHPFPLSKEMKNLKKLKFDCNVGIAHNGILDITSDGSKEYSDTMKFITDYLSLIIKNYSWYKNKDTVQLIENLIDGSRLCILDKKGHGEILGSGWEEKDGIWYSNHSYSYKKQVYKYDWNWATDDGYTLRDIYGRPYKSTFGKVVYDDDTPKVNEIGYDPYEDFYDSKTGEYIFEDDYCPVMIEDDESYCDACSSRNCCKYYQWAKNNVETLE